MALLIEILKKIELKHCFNQKAITFRVIDIKWIKTAVLSNISFLGPGKYLGIVLQEFRI